MTTDTSIITISPVISAIEAAGTIADQHASAGVFDDYLERKAKNTIRRQLADLDTFARYLSVLHIEATGTALQTSPEAWRGMTWGIIQGFVRWQLQQGYAIGSINVRLSTVKTYAKLAYKAGSLHIDQYSKINVVTGYAYGEGVNLDESRSAEGGTTRVGAKKATAVQVSPAQVKALKASHEDTPQGRRDRVLMCLLFDHGLRCGELEQLTVGAFDLTAGTFTFYREKVKMTQTHKLTKDARRAVAAYINGGDASLNHADKLLKASKKTNDANGNRELDNQGMSRRALTKRVEYLGKQIAGIEGLSAHDGRHTWATQAANNGTLIDRLKDAGGWSSIAMPARYIKAAEIANEGVKLGEDE